MVILQQIKINNMDKIIISTIFFIYSISFAQISIKIYSLDEKKPQKMMITITNETDKYYAVPFDKKGFKAYNIEELCSNLTALDYPHRFFAPVLIFNDPQNNTPMESLIGNFHVNDLNKKNTKRIKRLELKEKERVLKWKSQNHLTDDTDAIRNLYINENLILLAPKEKLSIEIEMDVHNIRRGNTYFYNYYILTNGKKYDLSIKLCADKNIYEYLTEKQKEYLKKYHFFTGILESNTISYIYKN